MPGQLQCKTRLERNPSLKKDYTSFFYDQDYDYKYFFYMRELKKKIKTRQITKFDDSEYEYESENESESDLEYPDLLDNNRIPISKCTEAFWFMFKISAGLMLYNMYYTHTHRECPNINGTFYPCI